MVKNCDRGLENHADPNPSSYNLEVIFQKRVRVFHQGFKHEKTDESTRPQAECFYCFSSV